MRTVSPKGFWEQDDSLFDFTDVADWRDRAADHFRDAGRDGDGREIGKAVSALARGIGDQDALADLDDSDLDPQYAPSWKETGEKPGKGGDDSTTDTGDGKGNGNGRNKDTSTDDGTTDDGSTTDTSTTDDGTTTDGSTDDGTTDDGTTTDTSTTDGTTDTSTSDAPPYAIDAITSGYSWGSGPLTVSYAFMESLPDYWGTSKTGFSAFNDAQRQATLDTLDLISQYTSVTFVESSIDDSNLAFGNASLGSGYVGYAYYPSEGATGTIHGDVWINTDYSYMSKPAPGNYAYMGLIHEIGHAMGLEHPHEGSHTLPSGEDTRQYTVESYNRHATMGSVEPQSYMTYDIAALQEMYGANTSWAMGDDVYDFSGAHNLIETIWDAGGIDTFDASGRADGVVFDLNAGSFSSVGTRGTSLADENVGIAYNVVIENAIGSSGNDEIVGNAADNLLAGGGGDDRLAGGAGSDTFRFDVDWGSDSVSDFEDGIDFLDFSGTGSIFSDLAISEDSTGTHVSFGDDSVTLEGFSMSWLDESDFMFA